MGGFPADRSAKNDHGRASQEVVIANDHTNPEPPDAVSTEDTTFALCAKKESEEIERATTKDWD